MFRKGIWRVGILEIIGSAKSSTVTILETDGNEMITRATGAAANRPSGAGYAVGCQYIASDTGAIYLNTGNTTSTTWTVLAGAAGSVTSADYATSSVLSAKIKDSAVTSGKIAAGAVVASKLATSSVTSTKYADSSITSSKFGASSVNTAALKDGNITSAKLATSSVFSDKIKDSAVTSGKIATGAVVATKLASNAVVAGKIKLSTVSVAVNGAATSGFSSTTAYLGQTILGYYQTAASSGKTTGCNVRSVSIATSGSIKIKMRTVANTTATYAVVVVAAS
jgi:hypothetical protein